MKIRIKDNSVRFRLTKSEVAQLCQTQSIKAQTDFMSNTFYYEIIASNTVNNLSIDFVDNKITLLFPRQEADIWQASERITYEFISTEKQGPFKILLEKDFACLDHSTEDQSDNYPNPSKTC